jgi:hypothetical protein
MILYLLVVFFIIIFNILIPNIIQKLKITNEIFESPKVQCLSNYWFYIDKTISGIKITYFTKDDNILSCDKKFIDNEPNICGNKGEYNNIYHPCYMALTNLMFLKSKIV